MALILPPDLEQRIASRTESGRFRTAADVVAEGLRLLDEREAALDELRAKIEEGHQQAVRGELIDGGAFLDDLLRRHAERHGDDSDELGQKHEDWEIEAARAHVRRLIDEGLDQADRGDLLDGEAVMDELERQLDDRSRRRSAHP